MFAWMNEEALRRTLETGRMWFWSRSRQEYWCKGETSGDRQYVRDARYDCDVDALLFVVEQEGRGRLPHRRAQLLLPRLRERRHTRARLTLSTSAVGLTRDEFVALARDHTVVPGVARGAGRPRDAGLGVREARRRGRPDDPPGFLLESVEHAERWGRFSFIGRDPALTLVVRGQRVEFDRAPPPGVPTDRGALAALEALLRAYRAPTIAELPPFHGGVVGLPRLRRRARDRAAPERAPRRPRASRRGAVGHRARHRVRPLPPAALPHRERVPRRRRRRRTAGDGLRRGVRPARRARRRAGAPVALRAVAATAGDLTELPPYTSTMPTEPYHAASRRRGSTSSPATSSRWCSRSASTSTGTTTRSTCTACCARSTRRRTCTSCATPEATLVGFVAGADGAAARRAGHQPPDRRHPPAGPHRGGRPAHGRRAHRSTRRSGPST